MQDTGSGLELTVNRRRTHPPINPHPLALQLGDALLKPSRSTHGDRSGQPLLGQLQALGYRAVLPGGSPVERERAGRLAASAR